MSDDKLGPETKYIPLNSRANAAYPLTEESCAVRKPFCYLQFERPLVQPYTFMMPSHMWEYLSKRNKLEFLFAVHFCMEHDVSKLTSDVIGSTGFNTRLYILFQSYLRKHYQKEAAIIIGIFQSNAIKTRYGTTFAVKDLVGLKGAIDDLRIDDLMVDAIKIARNDGHGTVVNRKLYQFLFNQDYNSDMVNLLKSQGIYADSLQTSDILTSYLK